MQEINNNKRKNKKWKSRTKVSENGFNRLFKGTGITINNIKKEKLQLIIKDNEDRPETQDLQKRLINQITPYILTFDHIDKKLPTLHKIVHQSLNIKL